MGVQPQTLQAGLVPRPPSTDTDRAHLHDHTRRSPAPPSRAASRSRSAAPPPTPWRAPVARWARRGLGRRRHHLAPGAGARQLDLLLDARRRPAAPRSRARAVDDSGNLETPGAGVTVNVDRRGRCPCSIWERLLHRAGATGTPARSRSASSSAPTQAGFITGLRFYKAPGNTGTHVGHLWTAGGNPARRGHLHRRDRAPAGSRSSFASPVAISREHHLRRLLPRAQRQLRLQQTATSPVGRRQRARCTRSPTASTGPTASTSTAPRGAFPTDTFQASNYWVDVVFDDDVGPDTTPPTVSCAAPRRTAPAASPPAPTSPRPSARRWTPARSAAPRRAPRPGATRWSPPPSATAPRSGG